MGQEPVELTGEAREIMSEALARIVAAGEHGAAMPLRWVVVVEYQNLDGQTFPP
jgi:hypothetical protein